MTSAQLKKKAKEGACFTIDVLGEEISSMEEANEFLEEYKRVIDAIKENSLDANISIKPKPTKIDCFITVFKSSWEALYKKNNPIIDRRVIEINKY